LSSFTMAVGMAQAPGALYALLAEHKGGTWAAMTLSLPLP
jgi:hypothetical protein